MEEQEAGRSVAGGTPGSAERGAAGGGGTASEVKGEVKARVAEVKEEVKDRARGLKEEAREKVREVKDRAWEEGESRKAELSDRARSVTAALESAADELDERGETWLADRARVAATKVEDLTRYLDERDVERLMGDLEGTARSNPGTFVGGAFAAGMALGRFLRSSTPEPEGGALGGVGDDHPARSEGGTEPEGESGRSGRWISGRSASLGLGEPERPGTRTGGAAMASREAGSARSVPEERTEGEGGAA